ncbi:MAG: DUF167 domain-containing protein [Thermoplasmata archaeon]
MTRISLWVKPGAGADRLSWDLWRKCWSVSCRAPPSSGRANESVRELMADWLDVPRSSVRWVRAGASRTKTLEVDGLTDHEVSGRLHRVRDRASSRNPPSGA